MSYRAIVLCTCCLASLGAGGVAQTEAKADVCVGQNTGGSSLPWSGMSYSISRRSVLLYNKKPTELRQRVLKFAKEMTFVVHACGGDRLIRSDSVSAVDFKGKVFAYFTTGELVSRDCAGHWESIGAITTAMWYDDVGDGKFSKILVGPELPPIIPAWVRREKQY